MDLSFYQEHVQIDSYNILDNCSEQPELCQQVGSMYAEAKARVKETELQLEELEASISLTVRSNPESYNLEKCTETSIKTVITGDLQVQKLKREIIVFKREEDTVKTLYDAYDHRKTMLKAIIEIMKTDYFTGKDNSPLNNLSANDKDNIKQKIVDRRKNGS